MVNSTAIAFSINFMHSSFNKVIFTIICTEVVKLPNIEV